MQRGQVNALVEFSRNLGLAKNPYIVNVHKRTCTYCRQSSYWQGRGVKGWSKLRNAKNKNTCGVKANVISWKITQNILRHSQMTPESGLLGGNKDHLYITRVRWKDKEEQE